MLHAVNGDTMINANGSGSPAASFSAAQTECKVVSAIALNNNLIYLTGNGIEI